MVMHLRRIGPNDALNGVWLRVGAHSGIHTNAYFHNINRILGKYYFNPFLPTAQLADDLQRIAKFLQARQFPV